MSSQSSQFPGAKTCRISKSMATSTTSRPTIRPCRWTCSTRPSPQNGRRAPKTRALTTYTEGWSKSKRARAQTWWISMASSWIWTSRSCNLAMKTPRSFVSRKSWRRKDVRRRHASRTTISTSWKKMKTMTKCLGWCHQRLIKLVQAELISISSQRYLTEKSSRKNRHQLTTQEAWIK